MGILNRFDHIPSKPYYNQDGLFTMPLPQTWPNEPLWNGSTWKLTTVQFSDRLNGCRKAYNFIKRHAEHGKGKTARRFGYKGPFYAAARYNDEGKRVSCTYLWGLQDTCLFGTPRWCGPFDVYTYCLHDVPGNFITPDFAK